MNEDAPVRLVRRKLGCSNRIMEVYLDDIEGQKGEKVCDFVVVVPREKSVDAITGVAILPILDGEAGLLRVYRHPVSDYCWEVPRGFVDAGESTRVSAMRELSEETGLACDEENMVDFGSVLPEPGILAGRTQLFVANRCRCAKSYRAAEVGHEELRFFSTQSLRDMIDKGAVKEASTLIVLYRYLSTFPALGFF